MKQDTTSTAFVIILSLVATIGGFLFGFDSGVINGTVEGFKNAFDSHSIGTGFNVASMLLGCVVGAFFTGMLAQKLERLSRMSSMITRTLTPLGKPLCWSLQLLQLSAVLSQGSSLDKLDGVRKADVSLDGTWHFQIPAPRMS